MFFYYYMMIVVGIDPGWKEFGYYIGQYTYDGKILKHIAGCTKTMLKCKNYTLKAMRKALFKWFKKRKQLLTNAVVIIEKQIKLRFQNIVAYLQILIPHAIIVDIRGMKRVFGISTGSHYGNKKAVVNKFGWMLSLGTPFKKAHNILDPFMLVLAYLVLTLNVINLDEIKSLPKFSKDIIKWC